MRRYVSLDVLRGVSIAGMIFVHILEDIYNMNWTNSDQQIGIAPMVAVIMLMAGLYFGGWAGLFLMVSMASNMISMYNNLERGKTIASVVLKQVLGGFILLIFSFLCEGTLQYYGVFQTIIQGAPDWSRILWKGYTMETIATIAWCMIINGIVQGLLSINGGYNKIRRNIIIYAILAIIVIIVTQPLWNWLYTNITIDGIKGYPFATYPNSTTISSIEKPDYPYASLWDYVLLFWLMPLHGIPEPIFPFLAVSFLGNIIGLKLCETPAARSWPKQGVWTGILIIISGFVVGILAVYITLGRLSMGTLFDIFFPMTNFSTFSSIGGGVNYYWLPWICFITGGQVIVVCLLIRLVEFRGKSAKFAEKTKIIRLFGAVPFSMYTWHRIIAELPLYLLSLIFNFHPSFLIDTKELTGWESLATIFICMAFIYGVLKLWEKVDFIGSLEWMMGTLNVYILGIPKKSEQKVKWYRWASRDVKLSNPEWINIFEEDDNDSVQYHNSKLAIKFSTAGILIFPFTFLGLGIQKSAKQLEGENQYQHRARTIGIIALIINITIIILLTALPFGTLGISL